MTARTITIETRYIEKQDATVVLSRYVSTDNLAIVLVAQDGEPLCTVTVNHPGTAVPDGIVCIKDYSENEGVLAALKRAGVIEREPVGQIVSGFAVCPLCKLTPDWAAYALTECPRGDEGVNRPMLIG